jgi:hypothetical protein
MIRTQQPYALLLALGDLPLQAAFLETYYPEDPELSGSYWDGIIGDGSDRSDPWTVFDDCPTRSGFWVWEGRISWTSGRTSEGIDEGADPILTGTWRRAASEEVLDWMRKAES